MTENTLSLPKGHIKAVPTSKARPISAALVIFVIAALLHLAVVSLFLDQPVALDDMFQYDMLARSLVQGHGYRWYTQADVEILRPYLGQFLDISRLHFPENGLVTIFRAPGYPFFLAGLYALVPAASRFHLARLVQALLMAGLAPLVLLTTRRLGLSNRSSLLAGLLAAGYPILLFYPVGLASEDLFIPLTALAFWALVRAGVLPQNRRLPCLAQAGALLGLASLARSILWPFILFAAVWAVWQQPGGIRWRLLHGAVLMACALVVCLPWGIRNTLVAGRPVWIENSLGYNLFVSYHPRGTGEFISQIAIQPLNILDDSQRDTLCKEAALQFIRADPLQAAWRVLYRAMVFFGPEYREFTYFYSNNLLGPVAPPLLVLVILLLSVPWALILWYAILGLWLAPRRDLACLAALFIAGYALPHLFILAEPRFHLALVPILLPFTAHGWHVRKNHVHLASKNVRWPVIAGRLALAVLWVWYFATKGAILIALLRPGGNLLALSY